jgi:type II secretory pathway component PulF
MYPVWLRKLRERPRNRNVYPVIVSISACAVGAWHLHLLLYRILPRFSPLVAERGETFPLAVRIAIATFGGSAVWLFLAVPLSLCVAVWVGLFWKPHRSIGPNALVTVCLVALLLIQLVFLLTLGQMAEIMSY